MDVNLLCFRWVTMTNGRSAPVYWILAKKYRFGEVTWNWRLWRTGKEWWATQTTLAHIYDRSESWILIMGIWEAGLPSVWYLLCGTVKNGRFQLSADELQSVCRSNWRLSYSRNQSESFLFQITQYVRERNLRRIPRPFSRLLLLTTYMYPVLAQSSLYYPGVLVFAPESHLIR